MEYDTTGPHIHVEKNLQIVCSGKTIVFSHCYSIIIRLRLEVVVGLVLEQHEIKKTKKNI